MCDFLISKDLVQGLEFRGRECAYLPFVAGIKKENKYGRHELWVASFSTLDGRCACIVYFIVEGVIQRDVIASSWRWIKYLTLRHRRVPNPVGHKDSAFGKLVYFLH